MGWGARASITSGLLGAVLAVCASPVEAQDGQAVRNLDDGYTVEARDEGEPARTKKGSRTERAASSSVKRCWHAPVKDLNSIHHRFGTEPSESGYYWAEVCSDGSSELLVLPRGGIPMPVPADTPEGAEPIVTPEVLAQEAFANLAIPEPQIKTAPARGKPTLVGLRTWFWLDNAQRAERSARAQAGGVWAEATAKAQRLEIQLGDGADPVVCEDLGRPYDSGRPANEQSTDCAVIFKNPGTRRVTVTVEWGGTWQGSGGAGGSLPTISRTTTFDVIVREARSELVAG
jgi:hypothetical protein